MQVPKKKVSIIKPLLITILIFILVLVAYGIYHYLAPTDYVEFGYIQENEVFGVYPIAIAGSVLNTHGENISISNITLVIYGEVIEKDTTYDLEEIMINYTSDIIPPYESVNFYIFPIDFRDEVLHTVGTQLTYGVKINYNGFKNDDIEFDASDFYDYTHPGK